MRILHVVESLAASTGGPSRTVPHLARHQALAGCEVALVTVAAGEAPSVEAAALCDSTVVLHCRGSALALAAYVRTHSVDFDIVHIHGLWNAALHLANRAAARPIVTSPRGMLEPWAFQSKGLKKRLAWRAYQRRDLDRCILIHATSEQEKSHLEKFSLRAPIDVVPNGVGEPPRDARKDSLPAKSILFLSRIDEKKGLHVFFRAVASTAAMLRQGGWKLFVVGPANAEYLTLLKRLLETFAINDLVEIRDEVDGVEKWSLLASATIFVLPTFSENFGVAVAESLASGVPVITTTGAPWRELIEHECGWWVDADEESLKGALVAAINTQATALERMGANGRAFVMRRYAWSGVALRMIHAYDRALVRERQRA